MEISQTRFPTRIAGRCGSAGGAFRPPAFILLHFRPHVSPPFYRVNHPLGWAMELVKCCEFVYEISVSLAWMTHTGSKKSCLSKRLAKMAQQGLVCEQGVFPYSGGESLTLAHTGGTAGAIRFCCYKSSKFLLFLGLFPKSFSLFMWRSFCIGRSSH